MTLHSLTHRLAVLADAESRGEDVPFIESCRREVEAQYSHIELSSGSIGGCFGSILCSELHHGGADGRGLHFSALAQKWGIPVSLLGELIWDHCKRLEPAINVNHDEPVGGAPRSVTEPKIMSDW